MSTVVFENRVRYAETDQQGVVFYGNYVTYQDEAFTSFLDAVGYDQGSMKEQGWDIHAVNLDLDFHQPAEFGDHLENEFRIDSIGTTSFQSEYVARQKGENDLVVEGRVTHVAVNEPQGETVRVPDDFREAVRAFQDVPPDEA
jgi:acyl-CoA thioester hydrolase